MGLYHGWDNDPDQHADFVRGGVNENDFADDFPWRSKARKSKKKKRYPGCTGNDNGPHIYVWTTEGQESTLFYKHFGFAKFEKQTCCGCGKVWKTRDSERYEKIKHRKWTKLYGDGTNQPRGRVLSWKDRRFNRMPGYSYWAWESLDDEYVAKVRKHNQQAGWGDYIFIHYMNY